MNFLTSCRIYFCDIKLFMSVVICSFQLILSSIIISKNFVLDTISIAMVLIVKLGFPLDPKTIQLVLLVFNDRIFALNQSDNIIISVCMAFTTSCNFDPVLYKVVSSANNMQSLLIQVKL